MRYAKMIFGLILITLSVQEWFNAYRQVGFSIGAALGSGTIILLGLWLFRNGKRSPKRLLPYMWVQRIPIYGLNAFLILMLVGLLIKPRYIYHKIKVAGIEIPLDACVFDSKDMLDSRDLRVELCECLAQNLGQVKELSVDQVQYLKKGALTSMLNSLSEDQLNQVDLESCYEGNVELSWTDEVANAWHEKYATEMWAMSVQPAGKIDAYCDCMVDGLLKYPVAEVIADEFYETVEYLELHSYCSEQMQIVDTSLIMVDTATGLMWMKQDFSFINHRYLREWIEVFEWKGELNALLYGGYSDWRVPTIPEYRTINKDKKDREYYSTHLEVLDSNFVWGNGPYAFWSSSTPNENLASYMSFIDGFATSGGRGKKMASGPWEGIEFAMSVRLVRGENKLNKEEAL